MKVVSPNIGSLKISKHSSDKETSQIVFNGFNNLFNEFPACAVYATKIPTFSWNEMLKFSPLQRDSTYWLETCRQIVGQHIFTSHCDKC